MKEPNLSAICSDFELEDGVPYLAEVELCGAQIVAYDKASGKPMLVKYQLGKGCVYTFTLWAYPGHEQYQTFAASWIINLCEKARGNIYVEDKSGYVFYTTWVNGDQTEIMLLNTDYYNEGNVKDVNLVIGENSYPLKIKERVAYSVKVKGNDFTVSEYTI
jgi:hypothetical protein